MFPRVIFPPAAFPPAVFPEPVGDSGPATTTAKALKWFPGLNRPRPPAKPTPRPRLRSR